MTDARLIYITTDSTDEAQRIGRALVEERLAACVNILGGMKSLYWWEGEVSEGDETVLIAKTRSSLVDDLIERVKALHSYSCPCAISVPLESGNPDYLAWIANETAR